MGGVFPWVTITKSHNALVREQKCIICIYMRCIPIPKQRSVPQKMCVCVCVNLYADMMTLTTLIFLRCDDVDSPWGRYLQLISTPFFAASLQTEGLVLHQTNLQHGEGGRNGTPWAAEIESLFASAASLNHLSKCCASNKKPSICIHPHHFCP